MGVRVHLCCPNPPAQAIAGVIAQAGATVVDASTVTDDVVRQGLDCDILALASTTLGSVAPARLIAHVRAQAPRVRVILLMDHEDQALIDEAMKAGFYDWTVGDAVAHELPRLLAQGRTYADVVRMPAVQVEERAAFAGGRPFRLVVGMAESAHAAVLRTLDRRHKGEYEVVAEARTFDALVQAITPDVDGVVTASFLTGPFDLTTRIRLLGGVTKGVVMMLLVPADPPEAEVLLEEHGFVGIRGDRVEQDGKPRLVFAPERFDVGFRRLAQAQAAGPGTTGMAPVTPVAPVTSGLSAEAVRPARVPTRQTPSLPATTPMAPPVPAASPQPTGLWGGETDAQSPPPAAAVQWAQPPRETAPPARLVSVPSRLIAFVSPLTGVGKTECTVNVAVLAGRLGIDTLLMDQSVLPPGNAALRLGFDTRESGLELLLMGPWDDDTFQRLRMRYMDTSLHVLRPISNKVQGTVAEVQAGAYTNLIAAARRQYPLTVVDTSPFLDDLSVQSALDAADRVVVVLDPTDDRVRQAIARVPWIVRSTPDPSRILYVINKVGVAGGWPTSDIMAALRQDRAKVLELPSEPARHAKAARSHRPITLSAGPRDPWSKLFLAVAGDMVPLDRRKGWHAEADVPAERPAARASGEGPTSGTAMNGGFLTWLRGPLGRKGGL